jgi:hypothetical protein
MVGRRTFLAVVTVAAVMLVPTEAAANGGAYVVPNRTHYVVGASGNATAYVSVPERKLSLFDRGPFYLFLLPEGVFLEEDRSIPASAMRIGTFTIEKEGRNYYELTASFTAPAIDSAYYSLSVCNDPCTLSGFREPLTGSISIVATSREAQLLRRNEMLRGRAFVFARQARRAKHKLESTQQQLDSALEFGQEERTRMAAEIEALETRLATARQDAADAARRPYEPWVLGAIVVLALLAAVLALRRRRLDARIEPLAPFPPELESPEVGNGNGNGNGSRVPQMTGQTGSKPGHPR